MAFPKIYQKLLERLPLSGGAMTGSLVIAQGANSITGGAKDGFVQINAAANSGGGQIRLYGQNHTDYPGHVFIYAKSGDAPEKALVIKGTGELTWNGKPVLCGESGGFPVGFIALYAGSNVPDGWFRCDGSTVANMQTNYPKLYAVLGTNVLPNYSGRTVYGSSSGINELVAAGLPNIDGTFTGIRGGADINPPASLATGAFYATDGGFGHGTGPTGEYRPRTFHFVASRSSSIYGASTTVTPPSVKTAVLIRHD